jgi:hypothetical protein
MYLFPRGPRDEGRDARPRQAEEARRVNYVQGLEALGVVLLAHFAEAPQDRQKLRSQLRPDLRDPRAGSGIHSLREHSSPSSGGDTPPHGIC